MTHCFTQHMPLRRSRSIGPPLLKHIISIDFIMRHLYYKINLLGPKVGWMGLSSIDWRMAPRRIKKHRAQVKKITYIGGSCPLKDPKKILTCIWASAVVLTPSPKRLSYIFFVGCKKAVNPTQPSLQSKKYQHVEKKFVILIPELLHGILPALHKHTEASPSLRERERDSYTTLCHLIDKGWKPSKKIS